MPKTKLKMKIHPSEKSKIMPKTIDLSTYTQKCKLRTFNFINLSAINFAIQGTKTGYFYTFGDLYFVSFISAW